MTSVIVFGPTGQIGSVAARTAAESGSKVWLAMRDTNKTIPGIDSNSTGTYKRVQADLDKPETVEKAVQTSGAKRAFLYLVHGASDHMKATFEALKSGGIEFVVFVSSFTIHVDKALKDLPPDDLLAFIHGKAEASLDEVFGDDHYVALRPGAFASNNFRFAKGISSGKVDLWSGVFEQDNVSPSDIGRVGGTILTSGPRNGQKKVYVYGPQIRTIEQSIREIAKIVNKHIEINYLNEEQALKSFIALGMPEMFAKYMTWVYSIPGPDKGAGERFPRYDEGVKNVELYTGRPAATFEQWVKENESQFR